MVFGLHVADFVVLAVYLVGVTIIGAWAARWVHSMADYIMPRRFGKLILTLYAYGTGTHSDQAVGVAAKTYTNGLSGIWYQWLNLFPTPFYWLIAPLLRRFRALTMGDVFEARYGRGVAVLYALFGMLSLSVTMGTMLRGSGGVVAGATGGQVSDDLAIAVMTGMFLIYGMAGGLAAAIITDFVQGVLTIVFSFMLLPPIWQAVGGMQGLRQSITDPAMFSLIAPREINLFYIVMTSFSVLVGIVTQPHTMGNCASGRTEMDGAVGFMGGSFIKRISTIAWCLTGFAAVAYFAGRDIQPNDIYGVAAAEFLPKIGAGMVGLFLASLLASVMSSCDSFMIASAALFTENIYKRVLPGRTQRHYIWVARAATFGVVVAGLGFAYWLPDVVKGLEIFWEITPMMGIAFWLGLYWRGATPAGAWAATLVGFAVLWLTRQGFWAQWLGTLPVAESWRLVFGQGERAQMYMPWRMVSYLSAGTLAGIVVSLLTRPVAQEALDRFYAVVRTPVRPGEPQPSAPCRLPEGVLPAPRRVLLPARSLEIPIPSARAVIGFAVGWVLVAAIIGVFVWITQ